MVHTWQARSVLVTGRPSLPRHDLRGSGFLKSILVHSGRILVLLLCYSYSFASLHCMPSLLYSQLIFILVIYVHAASCIHTGVVAIWGPPGGPLFL